MSEASANIYEEIRATITKILKIYHTFKVLNEMDDKLSNDMHELIKSCKSSADTYNRVNAENPEQLYPYAAHINALAKLTPALNLCVQEHNQFVRERLELMSGLTESLNDIQEMMKQGFVTMPKEELEKYHEKEQHQLETLRKSLPQMEKDHKTMRRRFEAIRAELEKLKSL